VAKTGLYFVRQALFWILSVKISSLNLSIKMESNGIVWSEYGPLYAIFKFPDISGPVIAHEHINGRGGDPFHVLFVFSPVLFKEKIR